ncbi:MAG TPA: hypothetical protein VFZ08_11570 [Terriglobia bacterium]|nr:hypothetical protein [Terriglobia bacterium]
MADFNLQHYRDRFPAVSQSLFGRTFNFPALEKKFSYLRDGSNWLSIGHILPLYDPAQTPYTRYWPRPDAKQLDSALRKDRVRLAPLERDEKAVVERLLRLLHNLGLVSLILRFTYPERFAIFSTPVAHLISVQRPGILDFYMAFSAELREWQQHFRMATAAETEIALWTFHHLSSAAGQNGSAEAARQAFETDLWIQRRRLARVLRPFMQRYGPLELARLLAEEDPKLAGKIAGEEHEKLLKSAARQFYPHISLRQKGWAEAVISLLAQDGRISLEEKTALRRIWSARNQAVHPDGWLDLAQIENMIDGIERICRRWQEDTGKDREE